MAQEPEDDQAMSFWEHLDELRIRLTRIMVIFLICSTITWYFKDPILKWLWQPFTDTWKGQGIKGDPIIHFAAPSDAFKAYFKISMISGLGLSAPVIFLQLWGFIAPGLYRKEKRYAFGFVTLSTTFFIGGAMLGWYIGFPITLQYFLGLTKDAAGQGVNLQPTLMIGQYLDFALDMLLAFGLVFELPLFLTILSMVGLVNYIQLARFGRWAVLISCIVAALLTPADVASMMVMAVPLVVLYFMSIGLAYVFGQRPTPEQIERDKRWREEKKAEDKARKEREKLEKEELKRQAKKDSTKA
jgi:sec-independent protein translocase protein TatC